MKLEFWKPITRTGNAKATIHKNGNLGFSTEAAKLMGINKNTYLTLGKNKENLRDTSIYILVVDKKNEYGLKVNKAGNYYYLNTKNYFADSGIDYIKKKIIYDISVLNEDEIKIYKLSMREIQRKKNRG